MKNKLLAVLVCRGCSILGVRAYAHHSFAATYFEDQKVTVHGKLVQFLYRNPHSFVHVEAADDKGEMQTWAVEWGAGGQLGRQGVTRETLKPGDDVIVVGNPGPQSRRPPPPHGEHYPPSRRLEVGRHVRVRSSCPTTETNA